MNPLRFRLFLVVVLVSGLFAVGCGKKQTEQTSKPEATKVEQAKALAKPENGQTYQIEAAKSNIRWLGKKVTGAHNGSVGVKKGEVFFDEQGKLAGGSIIIDMNSISNEDLTDAKFNQKLVDHLKSDDFFNVSKFPQAVFEITAIKAKDQENFYEIEGNMTIKGATNPAQLNLQLSPADGGYNASGKMVIDRTLWGLKYQSGKFIPDLGDKLIYDEIELGLDLTATKN